MKFYTNNDDTKMARMIDYELIAYDIKTIQNLNLINYMSKFMEVKDLNHWRNTGPNLHHANTLQLRDYCLTNSSHQSPKNYVSKQTCIIKWEQIAYYIKGIGRRIWYLNTINGESANRLDFKTLQHKGLFTYDLVQDGKVNNLVIALYEGIIRENGDINSNKIE